MTEQSMETVLKSAVDALDALLAREDVMIDSEAGKAVEAVSDTLFAAFMTIQKANGGQR